MTAPQMKWHWKATVALGWIAFSANVALAMEEASVWLEPVTGMELVHLAGGCYAMGAKDPALAAQPVHRVCVKGFWMGRHETSNAQYAACVDAKVCAPPERKDSGINEHFRTGNEDQYEAMGEALTAKDHPIVGVSWMDAHTFARWLSAQSGHTFRLPSEAEWEYGCRAGGSEEPAVSGGDQDQTAWYDKNSQGRTHAVGSKRPNEFGLFDMSGNVWEWVADHFDAQAYAQHTENEPVFIKNDFFHVTRGGSWSSADIYLNCAYRGVGEERDRDDNQGFRLVREE